MLLSLFKGTFVKCSPPKFSKIYKSPSTNSLHKQNVCVSDGSFKACIKHSSSATAGEMRVWQGDLLSGIEGLHLSSVKIPTIMKPNDVLVKVSAASVNPIDVAILGGYGKTVLNILRSVDQLQLGTCDTNPQDFPIIAGRDFVGEVIYVGHCVKTVKPSDWVWGVIPPQRQGSHAEYVVTESCNVSHKPDSLSDVEAASVPYVGLTSWSAAVFTGGLTPGHCFGAQVLVIGASGGLGTLLTQLLSAWGAQVTGVCSKDAFELVLSCGATDLHDYHDPVTMPLLTASPRFDLVIDAAGQNDVGWVDALKEWQNASYISLLSPLLKNMDQSGVVAGLAKSAINLIQQNVQTLSRGRLYKWAYFKPDSKVLKELSVLASQGKIRPIVQKVYSFEEAKDSYQHLKNGHLRGKIVIDFKYL